MVGTSESIAETVESMVEPSESMVEPSESMTEIYASESMGLAGVQDPLRAWRGPLL